MPNNGRIHHWELKKDRGFLFFFLFFFPFFSAIKVNICLPNRADYFYPIFVRRLKLFDTISKTYKNTKTLFYFLSLRYIELNL